MTTPLSPRARSEYVATVLPCNPRHSTPTRHLALYRALGRVRSATARIGWWPASVGKLAVIRRRDGQFVVDVDAGTAEHAADLLDLVRDQLARMTVDEFEHAWGVDRNVDRIIQRHLDHLGEVGLVPPVRSLPSVG